MGWHGMGFGRRVWGYITKIKINPSYGVWIFVSVDLVRLGKMIKKKNSG